MSHPNSIPIRGKWRRWWLASFADEREPSPGILAVHIVLILALFALVLTVALHQNQHQWKWSVLWRYRVLFCKGWITTLLLALAALGLSTVLGATVALLGRARFLPARAFARIYVELIRGTPLLVQIVFFFYVVADTFGVSNRYLVGILTLALFAGAYIAEIVRAGLETVGRSQWESARSLGLTRRQIYRWVVLPQMLRQILPPLAGQFVSLVKDSSLLSVIAISEFSQSSQQVNALTFSTLEGYLPLAVGYLLLTLPLSLWSRTLERRVRFDT